MDSKTYTFTEGQLITLRKLIKTNPKKAVTLIDEISPPAIVAVKGTWAYCRTDNVVAKITEDMYTTSDFLKVDSEVCNHFRAEEMVRATVEQIQMEIQRRIEFNNRYYTKFKPEQLV